MPFCTVAGADREVVLSSALPPFCDVAANAIGIVIVPVSRRIKLRIVLVVFVVWFPTIPVRVANVAPRFSEDCSSLWGVLSVPDPPSFPCATIVVICAANKCVVSDC